MLEVAREMQAQEKIEACDLQAISICTSKYYETLRSKYSSRFIKEELPKMIERPALKADSDEAKYFMMSLFAAKKGVS